jgi:hypothetical protein
MAELRELVNKREVGHPITIYDSPVALAAVSSSGDLGQRKSPSKRSDTAHWPRVSIYRGHPFVRNHSSEAGKLINLPATMEEFKTIIGTFKLVHHETETSISILYLSTPLANEFAPEASVCLTVFFQEIN